MPSRLLVILAVVLAVALPATAPLAKPPIYIAFHWHMHQPIYWPYESVVQTADAGRYGFNLMSTHLDRSGPYTAWPMDAVQAGIDAGLGSLGAQVSLSGSLMENLDAIEGAGRGFSGWRGRWATAAGWRTSRGNPRIDLVKFGYHHPLMALVEPGDIVRQIRMHTIALERRFGAAAAASKGIFPPETGFAEWMIPPLREAGVEWVIVDNIHFDRSRPDYPYSPGSNLPPPNAADQRNTDGQVTWVQLQNIWAPTKVATPWGYQPHHAVYVNPDTGVEERIVVVPAARYEGNEDARGGFGAFLYDQVMSQYEAQNTDDAHPMLIVLHHDGDNYGGGTDSYYQGNFRAFVDWVRANPQRFVATTIQDYLDQFPPAADDVIHVEPGSWAGADNGDPEFKKWNGDPGATGYSPDRASWAVIVAAENRVRTAEAAAGAPTPAQIVDGAGGDVATAWHYLLNGQTSCYWYWDGAENGMWDSHPARAANIAVEAADRAIGDLGSERVAPTLYLPQREPYNPGGIEWGTTPQPSDFTVWTLGYDASGLTSVVLKVRVDDDTTVERENLVRTGGSWQDLPMTAEDIDSTANPAPRYIARLYSAEVEGVHDALVDYYVEARDARGNVARSPIQSVWVGAPQGGTTDPEGVHWTPARPSIEDVVTVYSPKGGFLHWGVNGWLAPDAALWPAGSTVWSDGLAVESPLAGPDADGFWKVALGPFPTEVDAVDFVLHNADGTWDNNGGADWHIAIADEPLPPPVDAGGSGGEDVVGPRPDVPGPHPDVPGPAHDAALPGPDGAQPGRDEASGSDTLLPGADDGPGVIPVDGGGGCATGRGTPMGLGLLVVLALGVLRRRRGLWG